jgi:ribosome-associated heat shock protein Hsp15
MSRDMAGGPRGPGEEAAKGEARELRLDVWLDVACLFKTRSDAQAACRSRKLSVNGQVAKANRRLHMGDEIEIGRPLGRKQRVVVRGFADRHVPKAEARALYEDLTPPPTPEEIETRRLERMYRAAATPPRAPDKRQRRALRRSKGRDD